MTVEEGVADANIDWDAAAEMMEAVKEALCQIDPMHSLVEKSYPGAERWAFGWLTESEIPVDKRHAWIEISALQIAKGAVNVLGRGRRIRLTAICTAEGYGTVIMRAKPVPAPLLPPGGAEELGPQLVQAVDVRLRQLDNALDLFTAVPEGLAAEPGRWLFRILSPPNGIDECVSRIRESLESGTSYLLRPNFDGSGHFHIAVFRLLPVVTN